MRKLLFLFLGFALISCDKETVNQPPASSMILSKDQVALSSSNLVDSATVKLACGCDFQVAIDKYEGDTNVIKFSRNDIGDIFGNATSFVFQPDVNATPGDYQVKVAFRIWEPDETGLYGDEINVTYFKE